MSSKRLLLLLSTALAAVVAVMVGTAVSGSSPYGDGAAGSAATAAPLADTLPGPISAVPAERFDISLAVDRSRAPLADVADQFRARVVANPGDHTSLLILTSTVLELAHETGDIADFREAEALADRSLELVPGSSDAQLLKAQAVAARHGFGDALRRIDAVLAAEPDNGQAQLMRADALLELGRLAEASTMLADLHQREASAATSSRLGRVAFLTGDTAAAVEHSFDALTAASLLPLRPSGAAFYWFQLGFNLHQGGDTDGAATALEQALAIDPSHAGSLELLASVRAAQGQIDDAIGIYERLVDGGGAADLHGALAALLRLAGDNSQASVQLDLALDAAAAGIEDDPGERRHIAGFLVDHDPAAALALAEADLATRQDAYAHDLHAWALLAVGRPTEADAAMAPALDRGPADATIWFHAGVIAAEVGDTDRARDYLAAALALRPDFHPTDADIARATLASLPS